MATITTLSPGCCKNYNHNQVHGPLKAWCVVFSPEFPIVQLFCSLVRLRGGVTQSKLQFRRCRFKITSALTRVKTSPATRTDRDNSDAIGEFRNLFRENLWTADDRKPKRRFATERDYGEQLLWLPAAGGHSITAAALCGQQNVNTSYGRKTTTPGTLPGTSHPESLSLQHHTLTESVSFSSSTVYSSVFVATVRHFRYRFNN